MSTREAVKEADEETVTETGDKVSIPRRIARRAGRIPAGTATSLAATSNQRGTTPIGWLPCNHRSWLGNSGTTLSRC